MSEISPTKSQNEAVTGAQPELQELAAQSGPHFWKSLEHLSGTERFQDFIRREYPSQIARLLDPPQRRTVLKLMGASLALAGFEACTKQPEERILPYAKNPESTVPGVPLYFATAMPWQRGAIGLLVENHQGRPTKIEGNDLHPASLGSTDAIAQASVLGLYDPDRSTAILRRGRMSSWDDFLTEIRAALNVQDAKQGAGLRILTSTVTSPTLAQQLRDVQTMFPRAKIAQWDAINRENARAGALMAFGQDVAVHPQFEKAKVVLSLESDFLGGGPECVRATRDFTKNRKVRKSSTAMNRLYVVESTPTITGSMADHRLPRRSHDVEDIARRMAKRLGVDAKTSGSTDATLDHWIDVVAKDLESAGGAALVVVGDSQPAVVHALAHAMNAKLGAAGKSVRYLPPIETLPQEKSQVDGLRDLTTDLMSGAVELLIMIGTNPVYDAPADFAFAAALAKAGLRVHLAQHEDETSILCDWHLPEAHFLECWSDARALDGTTSIVQPLIAPLRGGKSAHELLGAVLNLAGQSGYDTVRAFWQKQRAQDFEKNWRRWLHDGVIPDTAAQPLAVSAKKIDAAPSTVAAGLELALRPDPTMWDGRFSNNGWLQELPKPLTKITWDNTVQMSPTTATHLGLATGDVVELEAAGRKATGPVWVSPGHADESVTVHLGFGRTRAGHVGNDAGFDSYALRTSTALWNVGGVQLRKTGETMKIASTQEHEDFELVETEEHKRRILRVRTIDRFQAEPGSLDEAEERAEQAEHAEKDTSMYTKFVNKEIATQGRPVGDYQWGMVIDLNACTACGACVTACQSENNIAVVGKDQVSRGREMHWIRIDRYFSGPKENPEIHHQPVPCMQCENAPCEAVCPVGATTHSPEGLNEMTYNRCVGTRYCSNNCPYKVRRFNFLLYSDYVTETLKLQRNPDVSVRSRGVMEKCTYCVQRINHARITSKKQDRRIKDGEIVTACQQVCPAGAIEFGDVSDATTAVARLKSEPHNYALIEDLNTRPRTTYLAKIMNPNPAMPGKA